MRRIMTLVAGGVCVGILCVMIFFHIQGIQVLAMMESYSESQKVCSVTLEYGREKPIQRAVFSIFRVAEKTENGKYRKVGDFENCQVQIAVEDVSRWREIAETLEIYALRDQLTPLEKGETDLNGRLKFENLGEGAYLIIGEKKTEGRKTYFPEPILLVLEGKSELLESKLSGNETSENGVLEDGSLENGLLEGISGDEKLENGKSGNLENPDEDVFWHMTVRPKYREEVKTPSSSRDHDDSSEKIRVRALKIWEQEEVNSYPKVGKQDMKDHPTRITVQLLRDGVIAERVVLSDENQWNCVWENLDEKSSWKVAEEVPEGYVVSIRQEGETFLLTNRREDENFPEEMQTSIDEPDLDLPDREKLPQTGTLWYLVGILGADGVVLWVCAGKIIKRGEAEGEKARRKEKVSTKRIEKKSGKKNEKGEWQSVGVWMLRILGTSCMLLAGIVAGKNSYDEILAWNHVRESQRKLEIVESSAKESQENTGESRQKRDSPKEQPLYLLDPGREMPEKVVDGESYIGVLEIPSLERELPVMSEWTDERLKQAPCRYAGSAYLQNLVIAGHNYRAHFSGIGNLKKGDPVIFTDMDGNRFFYEVAEIEILNAEETEKMTESWWALTLFTCTTGGGRRVAVRCDALV